MFECRESVELEQSRILIFTRLKKKKCAVGGHSDGICWCARKMSKYLFVLRRAMLRNQNADHSIIIIKNQTLRPFLTNIN